MHMVLAPMLQGAQLDGVHAGSVPVIKSAIDRAYLTLGIGTPKLSVDLLFAILQVVR